MDGMGVAAGYASVSAGKGYLSLLIFIGFVTISLILIAFYIYSKRKSTN